MHDKNTKSFTSMVKYLLNGYFFDRNAKGCIENPTKSLWWRFFAQLVNNF